MNKKIEKQQDPFIKIAKVGSPHGVSGGVKISYFPGSYLNLKSINELSFFLSDHFINYKIKTLKGNELNPILFFTNITNIKDAKFLQGHNIYISKEILKTLSINLPIELIGAPIFINSQKKNVLKIGNLKNILPGSSYEFLEIITKKGNEILVPFTDDFIEELDYINSKIIVSNKSGFFENEI